MNWVFFPRSPSGKRHRPGLIQEIVICSVVPDLNYSLRACAQKYFSIDPLMLRPGVKTGLNIAYQDPKEVGADRIADAVGAIKLFPEGI